MIRMKTILQRVKEAVTGFSMEDDSFDTDILIAINTIFLYLYQQNIGQDIFVADNTTTWEDFIKFISSKETIDDIRKYLLIDIKNKTIDEICNMSPGNIIALLEQYIILKTKILFDPPANESLLKAINSSIAEIEYRINIMFNDYDRG